MGQGGKGGWNLYLNEFLNKTGIVTFRFRVSERTFRDEIETEIGGNPRFLGESPL